MKNLSKSMLAILAVGLLSCGLFCRQAQADIINGTINFMGTVTLTQPSPNTFMLKFGSVTTTSGTGSYASIPVGTPVLIGNFSFNTETLENTLSMSGSMWEIDVNSQSFQFIFGAGFDLTSATATAGPSTWSFALLGKGLEASGSGFQSNAQTILRLGGTGPTETFTFTGSIKARVPDGGSAVGLLGVALVVLEGLRRRLRAS